MFIHNFGILGRLHVHGAKMDMFSWTSPNGKICLELYINQQKKHPKLNIDTPKSDGFGCSVSPAIGYFRGINSLNSRGVFPWYLNPLSYIRVAPMISSCMSDPKNETSWKHFCTCWSDGVHLLQKHEECHVYINISKYIRQIMHIQKYIWLNYLYKQEETRPLLSTTRSLPLEESNAFFQTPRCSVLSLK